MKPTPALECLRRAGLRLEWDDFEEGVCDDFLGAYQQGNVQPKRSFYSALGKAMGRRR